MVAELTVLCAAEADQPLSGALGGAASSSGLKMKVVKAVSRCR